MSGVAREKGRERERERGREEKGKGENELKIFIVEHNNTRFTSIRELRHDPEGDVDKARLIRLHESHYELHG